MEKISNEQLQLSVIKLTDLVENLTNSMERIHTRIDELEDKIKSQEDKKVTGSKLSISTLFEKRQDTSKKDKQIKRANVSTEKKELTMRGCCLYQTLQEYVILETKPENNIARLIFNRHNDEVCLMEISLDLLDEILIHHQIPKQYKITNCKDDDELEFDLENIDNIIFYNVEDLKFLTNHKSYILPVSDDIAAKIKASLTCGKAFQTALEKYVIFSTRDYSKNTNILYANYDWGRNSYYLITIKDSISSILLGNSSHSGISIETGLCDMIKLRKDSHITIYKKEDVSQIVDHYIKSK